MTLRLGSFVEHQGSPGIGRVAALNGDQVDVEYFESVAEPVVGHECLPIASCRPVRLQHQTRIFRLHGDTGEWMLGRIVGGQAPLYYVRFPNMNVDLPVTENELRVRWDRPVRNPVDVLASVATETPVFRDARTPLLRCAVRQRAACRGITALLSAAIEIYPHQVHTAMTVLQDPVQRYLLADEVGLGKTIEAGIVIRQTMLDRPEAGVAVIAPDRLRRQWQQELREKFFVDDFPRATLKIGAHEHPDRWSGYHGFDLVVVDEAHLIQQGSDPTASPYRELAALAHAVPRLLLLSATPATVHPDTHLGLLHLLDPHMYRWDDLPAFLDRLHARRRLADAVYVLDCDFEFLLAPTLAEITEIFPEDQLLQTRAEQILGFLTADGELRDAGDRAALGRAIETLRAHIGETYRLHRRMIRHRRTPALVDNDDVAPFEIRGRLRPSRIAVQSIEHDAAQEALLDWHGTVADWLIDTGRPDEYPVYGRALSVLTTRTGGSIADLADALAWRLHGDVGAADRAALSRAERAALQMPAAAPGEHQVFATVQAARADGVRELAVSVARTLRRAAHALVFCGPGALASALARELPRHLPAGLLVRRHTLDVSAEAADRAIREWTSGRGVLVVDGTGEDGLNLQIADVVVHCRLPASPNALEQRLGRVDRYAAPLAGRPATPARQFVLEQAEGEFSVAGAWSTLLVEGYHIFDRSLSTLQNAITTGLDEVWSKAVVAGPSGLTGQAAEVRRRLEQERKEIEALDLIESVYGTTAEADAVAAEASALEADWRSLERAVTGYAETGLRLHRIDVQATDIVRFDLASRDPLLPPRLLTHGDRMIGNPQREGAFNRNVALRLPGTRVFRVGHPFVDLLGQVMAIDDRGQAAALWRPDRGHAGDPEVYFAFDVLVEASVGAALALVDEGAAGVRHALRRHADRVFPPFVGRVWVRAGAERAETDPALVHWLDWPYDKRRGDLNLNAGRVGALTALFGTRGQFAQAARVAAGVAKSDLGRVTDLVERSAAAAERAHGQIEVLRAQARARRAAGNVVGDTDAYLLDVRLEEAFVAELRAPGLTTVGATCLVRSAVHEVPRDPR